MDETLEKREQAILVGLGEEYARESDSFHSNPLDELNLLAETAGADVVGTIAQGRSKIDKRYYIGAGKAEELHEAVPSGGGGERNGAEGGSRTPDLLITNQLLCL